MRICSAKKIVLSSFFLLFALFIFANDGTSDETDANSTSSATNSIDETKIELDAKADSQNKESLDKAENETTQNQNQSSFDLAVEEKPVTSASRLFQLLGALIIVCLLAYIVIKFLKKSTTVFGVDDPYLKTVASMNIAQNKSIHVITLGEKAYIIGVSDSSINKIAEVEDKNLIDAMNLEAERKSDIPKKDFSSVFSQFFPNIRKDEKTIGKEFFASQSERLNKANQFQEDNN